MVVGPVARRRPIYVDDAQFLRARRHAHGQVHAARADDDGRHALRRALQQPREARDGRSRRSSTRRRASIAARGRRRDPVRRARVQRLLRRGARLGHRRARARAPRASRCTTAVHICYGYGIKANIDWKKTLGSEWRQYEQTLPAARAQSSHRPGVARMRELARADRPHRRCSAARTCWSARSTSPPTGSRRRRRSPTRSARRWSTCPPSRSTPAPTAGWCRCPASVARGKLRALGAGAALVRRELDA